MNTKEAKKIKKNVKYSFILFLRKRPRWLPKWLWRLCAVVIFNDNGLDIIEGLYNTNKKVKINGIEYKIKNL